ncbi:MAG: hypothetical protein KDB80_15095, partial [Planctomycetes bacterium]|nr:hypothetical protein [Planctomycetota bacterium]
DPYRAASLQHDGFEVRTGGFVDDPLGEVPGGLVLGTFQIWGYERDGRRLPIGFFVDPVDLDGAALVTLWTRAGRAAAPARDVEWRRQPLEAYALSDTGLRWFARVPFERGVLPLGTQVVRGDRLVGRVTSAGHGYAFVTPLGGEGSRFEAWLVTDRGSPIHVEFRVIASSERELGLRVVRGTIEPGRGALFTTSSGGAPGLWIGDVDPGPKAGTFVLERAASPSEGGLSALVHDGGGS